MLRQITKFPSDQNLIITFSLPGNKGFWPMKIKRQYSKIVAVFWFLTSPVFLHSQDTLPVPLTIQQAVDSALINNLKIENAKLEIDKSKAQKTGSWDITPTEFYYQRGQINSSAIDRYLELNQNFGSILTHVQTFKKAKINEQYQQIAYDLAIKQLSAEVKSAYLFWQYMSAISILLAEKKELYEKLADISVLRYNSGDIDLLKTTMAKSEVAEVTGNYLNSLDNLVIAENKLKQLMMISGYFVPQPAEPSLIMITKKTDTSSFSANLRIKYLTKKYDMIKADEAITKSKYFPEIKAGIFTQDISNTIDLFGWQIEIAFPLWVPKQQADIRQSKIESEIAFNNLEYERIQMQSEIENLLFQLNKNFRQIRYYQENALPQAEMLIHAATAQLKTEEIDYTEYIRSISVAIKIKQDYYLAIHDYNQTAIQLEIYEE
jgi:cobalt-zinc-cadmium resistance protein CzcA